MTKHELELLEIIKKLQKRVEELEAKPTPVPQPVYIPYDNTPMPYRYYQPYISDYTYTSGGTSYLMTSDPPQNPSINWPRQ